MKMPSSRAFLFGAALVTLTALGGARLSAQSATSSPGDGKMPPPLLDHDEMTQLSKARDKVFAQDPALQAENEKLKAMHDATQAPTSAQRDADFAEWQEYRKKMRAEMLQVDPTLKPVFAKIDSEQKSGASPAPFQPASK